MGTRYSLDRGWRFHEGDILMPQLHSHHETYTFTKTERGLGAAEYAFDDGLWQEVNLPHDYQVLGQPREELSVSRGMLPRNNGWYRRRFTLTEAYAGKRLLLVLDAVATHATVWVNGCIVNRNFCGYTPIACDISSLVYFDGRVNVIAVYTDCREIEGWYYEGAGIYRHVWLEVREQLAPDLYGIAVEATPERGTAWSVSVKTDVYHSGYTAGTACVRQELLKGDRVLTACEDTLLAQPRENTRLLQSLTLTSPELWDLEHPALYTLRTTVTAEGQQPDVSETTFGCRTMVFDAEKGFFLNGRHVPLNGVSNHQDFGPLGVAVPDNIHRRRIQTMKEMGATAWRCAHNPPAPEFLDACDRMGMLVMDETRWFEDSEDGIRRLEAMVKRDRNHPSIFIWSLANEEPFQADPRGRRIYKAMRERVRKLDSRPTMMACNGGFTDDQVFRDLDVIGMNYSHHLYDYIHRKYPKTPLMGSETCADLT